MSGLSDATLEHLRALGDAPALDGTRYRLVGELGRGGMGVVYRVHDRELGRDVALKVVGDLGGTPDAVQRLIREARALARLEHPGIVPVHDAGKLPDGRAYYTMALVRGVRLDAHLEHGMTRGDALRLFARLCEVVAFAHARGVIHRDLKPQNVMLGPFGEVLVLDWGLAKVVTRASPSVDQASSVAAPGPRLSTSQSPTSADAMPTGGTAPERGEGGGDAKAHAGEQGREQAASAPDTRDGVAIGTPGFMAPEQEAGDVSRLDERTDIYALGALLRRMIAATGSPVGRPLAAIIDRATASHPSKRYPSVSDLAADIARLQDGLPVSAYRENVLERVARVLRRHRVAVALIAAYLIMRVTLLLVTALRD